MCYFIYRWSLSSKPWLLALVQQSKSSNCFSSLRRRSLLIWYLCIFFSYFDNRPVKTGDMIWNKKEVNEFLNSKSIRSSYLGEGGLFKNEISLYNNWRITSIKKISFFSSICKVFCCASQFSTKNYCLKRFLTICWFLNYETISGNVVKLSSTLYVE